MLLHILFLKKKICRKDTVLPQVAYYASLAAAKMENYPAVLKYAPFVK
jgi:hypothetical protein